MCVQCFEIQSSIQVMGSLTRSGLQGRQSRSSFLCFKLSTDMSKIPGLVCAISTHNAYGSILPFGKSSGPGPLLSRSVKEETGTWRNFSFPELKWHMNTVERKPPLGTWGYSWGGEARGCLLPSLSKDDSLMWSFNKHLMNTNTILDTGDTSMIRADSDPCRWRPWSDGETGSQVHYVAVCGLCSQGWAG